MLKPLAKPQRFIVRPAPGWLDVTYSEVQDVLASPLQKYKFASQAGTENGVVHVSQCDYRQALELVLRLTTAHDVEWVAESSRITSRSQWQEFFAGSIVSELRPGAPVSSWSIAVDAPDAVIGTAKSIKEAALAAWVDKSDELSADVDGLKIRIEAMRNRSRILVSLAGAPLYQRGYKILSHGAVAPLPEHHAAACYRWAERELHKKLNKQSQNQLKSQLGTLPIVVPFAGTGTLAFEGLLQACHLAPGQLGRRYSCEDFSFHPAATMKFLRTALTNLQPSIKDTALPPMILGDISTQVVDQLAEQVRVFQECSNLKINATILIHDFLSDPMTLVSSLATGSAIFMPLNPPYGLRLAKETGGLALYHRLGLSLTQLQKRHDVIGYVLCPDEESWRELLKHLSAKTDFNAVTTRHFSHGGLDLRLCFFMLSSAPRRA